MIKFKFILFFLFLFFGCRQNKESKLLIKSKNKIKLTTLADLLDLNYIEIKDLTILHKNTISNLSFLGEQSDTLLTQVLDYKFINKNNRDLLWIVIVTKPIHFDCHPCAPALGSVLFSKKNNKWSLLSFKYFIKSGNFGDISPYKWYKIDDHQPAFLIESGITNQGYTVEDFKFYTILNDTVAQILQINNVSEEHIGQTKDLSWSYSSSIDFQNSDGTFKNLIINKTGTSIDTDMNSLKKVDSIEKYKFYFGKYHLVEKYSNE